MGETGRESSYLGFPLEAAGLPKDQWDGDSAWEAVAPEGGTPGLAEQRGLGRERRQRVLILRLLSGDHPSAPPRTLGQTARRPPGSLQIALARGEGALRHRLLGEGRTGHAVGWGTWAPRGGRCGGRAEAALGPLSFQSPGSGV